MKEIKTECEDVHKEKKTKSTTVLQLVRSERCADGRVRQQIVLSLGDMKIPDDLRKTVAHEVEYRMNGCTRLEALDYDVAQLVDAITNRFGAEGKLPPVIREEIIPPVSAGGAILHEQIEHENGTQLGPLLPLMKAWSDLSLSELSGYNATWRKVRRLPATHCYRTLIIPSSDNMIRRIRKPGRPDERQRLIYEVPGIELARLPIRSNVFRKKDVKRL